MYLNTKNTFSSDIYKKETKENEIIEYVALDYVCILKCVKMSSLVLCL